MGAFNFDQKDQLSNDETQSPIDNNNYHDSPINSEDRIKSEAKPKAVQPSQSNPQTNKSKTPEV